VQGYLAAISCMDAQVGRLLDALDRTGRAQRTIVVLFGDNGYHLGEKGITGKNTLWERSTRVPLVIAAPGLPPGRCAEPAELLDLYPTLAELAGLTPAPGQEGHSLVPQLRDAAAARPWPAITSHGPGNTSVRSREARLIRYADGSEEFYDLAADPHEYANRAADPAIAERKAELARWIPAAAPPHPASRSRLIDYRNGTATWEGTPIATDAPWPTVMPLPLP
jgi:arylsulfatase A-like enzyme